MPTEKKVQDVQRLRRLIEDCVVAITADHSRMKVIDMTNLRRALREKGVEFHVVKNRLAYLAADAAGRAVIKDVVKGPTGIAFGFDDPLGPAKALTAFITSTKSPLRITGGVLGERTLSADEVGDLAALPGKQELLARLAGQLQGPMTSLTYVLNGPISALARVLQRRIEDMPAEGESGTASEPEASTLGAEAEGAPSASEAPTADSPEGSAEAEGAPPTSEASAPEGSAEAEGEPTISEAPTPEPPEGSVEAEGAPADQ